MTETMAPGRSFVDELREQRWDDHRYYHRSYVNQTLHLFNTRGHGDRFLPVLPGLIAELNGAKIRDL